jgi:hypothetical protein
VLGADPVEGDGEPQVHERVVGGLGHARAITGTRAWSINTLGIVQRGIEAVFEGGSDVLVVGVEGDEGLMAAAVVALGLEVAGHGVTLAVADPNAPGLSSVDPEASDWAASVAQWFAEQGRPVEVVRWDGRGASLESLTPGAAIAAGGAGLLAPTGAVRERLEALRDRAELAAVLGLGAEAARGADPDEAQARLTSLAAVGALHGVEAIRRFGTVGRHFVELVEHVHHRAGPTGQSVVADTIRAALFGRHGEAPVSLATRERPPRLGIGATLVFYLDLAELLAR